MPALNMSARIFTAFAMFLLFLREGGIRAKWTQEIKVRGRPTARGRWQLRMPSRCSECRALKADLMYCNLRVSREICVLHSFSEILYTVPMIYTEVLRGCAVHLSSLQENDPWPKTFNVVEIKTERYTVLFWSQLSCSLRKHVRLILLSLI